METLDEIFIKGIFGAAIAELAQKKALKNEVNTARIAVTFFILGFILKQVHAIYLELPLRHRQILRQYAFLARLLPLLQLCHLDL